MFQQKKWWMFIIIAGLAAGLITALVFKVKQNPTRIIISKNYHNPVEFVQSLKNDPHAGEKIYQYYCSTCHAEKPVINMDAPRIANRSDWKPFSELGSDKMLGLLKQGVGQMPPRGGCFECNDDQLKQAIIYMLPTEVKKK